MSVFRRLGFWTVLLTVSWCLLQERPGIGSFLLGLLLAFAIASWLARVQNDLLDVGADLSVPGAVAEGEEAGGEHDEGAGGEAAHERPRLRVGPDYTSWLEQACDEVNATLAPLRSFVIPGGTPAAAQLHVCRTVCRRAERRSIAAP